MIQILYIILNIYILYKYFFFKKKIQFISGVPLLLILFYTAKCHDPLTHDQTACVYSKIGLTNLSQTRKNN